MQAIPATIGPPDYTAIAKRYKDGSVLLSISEDRICKLNGVGTLIWIILEQNARGLTVAEVVNELKIQFEAINAAGELRYEVSHDQLWRDAACFLKNMTEMCLLSLDTESKGRHVYCIKEGVLGTTRIASSKGLTISHEPHISPLESDRSTLGQLKTAQLNGATASADEDIQPLRRETLIAFLGLATFDFLLKFAGFQSLIKTIESWPTTEPRATDLEACKRVRAMVDRAQMYYPKKALCLQHSAVVTCLLRRRGIPAQMVLAASEFPVKAHAWVEVAGNVVNDNPKVQSLYRILDRR